MSPGQVFSPLGSRGLKGYCIRDDFSKRRVPSISGRHNNDRQ